MSRASKKSIVDRVIYFFVYRRWENGDRRRNKCLFFIYKPFDKEYILYKGRKLYKYDNKLVHRERRGDLMPFTSENRKEYSSTILSKINSLKQDEKSIESQQQSAIDNYDDSTSNDYSNRKLMIDSQSTLTGAARELCCISNYKIDYSTKNTSFIKNGYVNIGKYITNYPYDVYRFDSPYFFSVLEKYSASRVKGVINNSNGIYQGNMITPDSADESLAPIIGSPSEMSSEFVKYNESGNKNNTIEDSIGAVTEILDSAASSGTLNSGIDYSSEDSYKILKFMGDNKEYPTFKC